MKWVIKEARLLEIEICSTAKTKKRKQRDEKEPSKSQSKRIIRRDDRGNISAVAAPGISYPRRGTHLSTRRTSVKD